VLVLGGQVLWPIKQRLLLPFPVRVEFKKNRTAIAIAQGNAQSAPVAAQKIKCSACPSSIKLPAVSRTGMA
jgi:hypothetical protein